MYSQPTRLERFWSHVDPCRTDGCAVWLRPTGDGYGSFWNGIKLIAAHHFLIGKPPLGLVTDHLCHNRACIWPEHLEFVTQSTNVRRGANCNPNLKII